MYAWRVHEYGNYREKLLWEECADPSVPDQGVVVEIKAAGINFPDLLAIAGQYQVKAPLPFIPGIEASGVVVEAGTGSAFAVGERLIVNNLWGAFAQRMAALDTSCFRIPEDMPDSDAAALLVIYQTSYFGLVYRARLERGETLLVHGGAGGVGTSAIQIGKALGATVIATAGSASKLEICREHGADHVINYREEDFVSKVGELTGGRGADVIYDPVGGDVFDQSTRCISFGGRLLVVGFASGRIPEIKANRILLKNIAVVGLYWGNYRFHQPDLIPATHDILCDMYRKGEIKPAIYREMPLAELPEALDALQSRKSYGKIILVP